MSSRRMLRRLAALVVAFAAFTLVPTASFATPLPSATSTVTAAPNAPGSQWLASCLNSGRTLSVLFVLDVSGSLDQTDPSLSRYEGLETALSTLATAEPADGSDVTIEAAVAAFGNTWRSPADVVGWQRINVDSPQPLIDNMVGLARDRTAHLDEGTYFSTIFDPAIRELTTRGGGESCKAIVWFTDGDNDATDPSADLCRVGGAIDQMRAAGIVLVGLRLGATSEPLMATMALGASGGQTCGTNPIPEGYAPGIYLAADDVKRLFASIQNIVEGCTITESPTIDPGIRRVRVNIYQGVDSVKFDLPGGISFTAGADGQSGPFDGIHVTSVKEDFYVSMELSLPAGVGTGDWLVSSTVPLAPGDIEYCVFSDLHLALDADSTADFEAGAAAVLTVNVLDPDDEPADLSVFASAATAASLIGPDGLPRTVEASMNPNGRDIDLFVRTETTDARLDLSVTLALTTESGLALTPLTLETAVITALNEYYPTVTPLDELDLGEAVREDPASAELQLVGSERGPTSVCFAAPEEVSVPPDAVNAAPVYATGCIDLAPGETRVLTVSVSTTTAVEGDGSALLPMEIRAAPDATGFEGVAELKLPVVWRFSNPLDVGILIWAFVVVVAVSIIVPLLAVLWANWITARFDVTNLRVARIPLTIDGHGISLVSPIPGSDVIVSGFGRKAVGRRSVVLVGRRLARQFTIDGVRFRSKASWSPFRPARFWAESPAGTVLLSSFGQPSGRDVRPHRVPFAPAFNAAAVWVAPVAAIQASGPATGTLIVLTTSGGRRGREAVDPETLVRGAPWVTLLDPHRPTGGPPSTGVDLPGAPGLDLPGSGHAGLLPPPGTPGLGGGGAGILPPPS